MMRDRFTELQEGFAMMRGEIARERHFSAALRAIKSAVRRYNGQKHAPVRGENAEMKQ